VPALALVVVHWRAEEDLAALLAAVPADPRWEVVVVDNGSTGLPPLPAGARLVRPPANLGFAGGANLGIGVARAPLVLLLNPDVVPAPGALDALLAGLTACPDAGGLAPRLTGPDGASQAGWQLRPLPRPGELLLHALLFDPRRRAAGGEPPAGAAVEQPAAAALALRRDALERVGGLDPGFHPAWFEDVDLARRLRAAGETLRYWPAAAFQHRLGGSIGPLGYGRFLWCYHRNLGRYLTRHHGGAWALAARALLLLAAPLRALLLPLRVPRGAAGRRSALRGLGALALGALTGWRRPRRLARGEE
jgi:GT2 family glycosyltransferase